MDAVAAEYHVRHRCQRQSTVKIERVSSSSIELHVEHCILTNTCMQRARPAWSTSQKDRASGVSEHASAQRCVLNGQKRESLCVFDDALEILPWQTPKYGVAYSCSYVLLVLLHHNNGSTKRTAKMKRPPQGSPQEFLPAGEKAGKACQWVGGPGALPRKNFGLLHPKYAFFGIFG